MTNPQAFIDPIGLQSCVREDPTWGGRVNYGSINSLGRRPGITATLEPDMMGIKKGTRANGDIPMPGWQGSWPTGTDARGHLLGRQLGGSGDEPANLVAMYQCRANSPVMSGFEGQVRKAVEGNPAQGIAGQTVKYKVTPLYDGSQVRPRAITMEANGSGGFHLNVTILNRQ